MTSRLLPPVASLAAVDAALLLKSRNKMAQYFPDTGPCRRELYPKHMAVIAAGATKRERALVAGNRIGKTELGCYELACHLTGKYPHWWTGRRFPRPINAWAAGNSNLTTRDILQAKLLGKMKRDGAERMDEALGLGTGMVPADYIKNVRPKNGIPDAIETAYIRHESGGVSVITFKSYEQERSAFEGTEQDVILFDEEPPLDVYTEAVLRTMATGSSFKGGLILLTFTPMKGWTDVIAKFFDDKEREAAGRHLTQISWDEVPHLSESEKAALLSTIPEYQRDARSKGIPQLGSGAIYPVAESEIVVDPFGIPAHWPRCFGMDVGWNYTAAIWLAKDQEADRTFAYSEMYAQKVEPAENVWTIKARGPWIPGVIDPASRGRSQVDGTQLIQVYRDLGLNIEPALNAREAGITAVLEMMQSGRLKIFSSLVHFLAEFRKYRRDDKGNVVKKEDHLMDATRYAIKSGIDRMRTTPPKRGPDMERMMSVDRYGGGAQTGGAWMA